MSVRQTRPSPSVSATLYPPGTKRKGNDGLMWTTKENCNGVPRWVRMGGGGSSGKKTKEPKEKRSGGQNPLTLRLGRPSPSISATLFSVGARRQGNDGAMWTVTANSRGIQRWVRVGPPKPFVKKIVKQMKATIKAKDRSYLRPSPSQSATLFKIGTIRKGNDGQYWIIRATKDLVHRWQRV